MPRFVSLFPIAIAVSVATACSAAPEPSPEELAAAATSDAGAFDAFDEACLGTGDLGESVPRAQKSGWTEFTPVSGSMFDNHSKMLLEGPAFDRPEVVLLRKNSNRALVAMWETRTLSGSDYIFQCEVVEEEAQSLNLAALKEWAKVPIELRQIEDSPVFHDLKGGRFANGIGGDATAYFSSGFSEFQTLRGVIVSTNRSSFPEEGTK